MSNEMNTQEEKKVLTQKDLNKATCPLRCL